MRKSSDGRLYAIDKNSDEENEIIFGSDSLKISAEFIRQQLQRYFSACAHAGTSDSSAENYISETLLHEIREWFDNDFDVGGLHDTSEGNICGNGRIDPFFSADDIFIFCGYETAVRYKRDIADYYSFSPNTDYSLAAESKNLLNIKSDLHKILSGLFGKSRRLKLLSDFDAYVDSHSEKSDDAYRTEEYFSPAADDEDNTVTAEDITFTFVQRDDLSVRKSEEYIRLLYEALVKLPALQKNSSAVKQFLDTSQTAIVRTIKSPCSAEEKAAYINQITDLMRKALQKLVVLMSDGAFIERSIDIYKSTLLKTIQNKA